MLRKLLQITFLTLLCMTLNAKDQKFYYSDTDFLSYVTVGSGDTNLVMLHGFGASRITWTDIVNRIDTTRFKLFLIDLKGFGESSIPKDGKYAVADHAKIIQSFIHQHVDSNFYLMGHSYGGGISLYLSSQKMVQPKKLILFDCAAYNWDIPLFIKVLKTPVINRSVFLFSPKRLSAKVVIKQSTHKDNYREELVDRYSPILKGKGKAYSFSQMAKQIKPSNYQEIVSGYSEISIPTLILWGEDDEILSVEQGKELHKQIENSELHLFENCGHIVHEELPDRTFQVLVGFLNK